ncbi:MAG: ATP-binding cassette domain-containing protein [Rhodospirillales bacterium]|nr:ATP-binding cassette domain-containing protein [Rhodospirillales bacterium]
MVRLEQVSLRYGDGPFVLRNLSFSLDPGSFHYVTGASGAGKTSLLRLITLAQRPSAGRVAVLGRDSASLNRHARAETRRRIGMVFQEFRLLDHQSVLDNVMLPMKLIGHTGPQVEHHVRELLSWVGLGDALEALPPTLSGGQQQRVAIARAVISRPNLLLADEPTGNVDDRIAARLLYLFEELNRLGTTVLIATHNEHLIEQFKHPVIRLGEAPGRRAPAPAPPAADRPEGRREA